MRGFRLVVGIAAIAAMTAPALAVCPICNSSVRFDSSLATCFAKRVEGELQRFKSEAKGFVIVNLSDCPSTRQALPTATRTPAAAPLDSSFVADEATLKCLGDAIARHEGSMDPSVLFDLAQICS